jgi:integrase
MPKPRRTANGQAIPYQRASDKRWCVSLTLGYDTATGKPIRKTLYGATSAEVARKKAEFLTLHARGQTPTKDAKSTTVKDLCEEFLDAKKRSWTPATYASAEQHIRLHILPTLGAVRLTSLDTRTVSKWLRSKPEARHMQLAREYLRAACDMAIRYEWIDRNPVAATEPVKREKKPPPEISKAQILAILKATKENRYYGAVCLMLGCGLRASEVCGLKWSDWDESTTMLKVERQVSYQPGLEITLAKPKSRASVGDVQVSAFTAKMLIAHRERQRAEKAEVEANGGTWGDEWGLMFTTPRGKPATHIALYASIQRDLKAAGIVGVTLHHLRHAFASLLIDRGVPITEVADALRHASPGVTMQIYAHKIGGKPKRTGAIMDSALFGDTEEGEESQG